MILKNLQSKPTTDPSDLIRLRDSVYATDLLITAIGYFNFFTWLNSNPSGFEAIINRFEIASRPADVMLTYLSALGLIEKRIINFIQPCILMNISLIMQNGT